MLVICTAIISIMNTDNDPSTTDELAATPTPSVPLVELYPLKQLINPIANPKKKVLIKAGKTSENSKLLKTCEKNKWKLTSPFKFTAIYAPYSEIASPTITNSGSISVVANMRVTTIYL